MESPLRFQIVVAIVAIGGALLLMDGPAPTRPDFSFQDATIDESSGLVDLGDSVLTVNDSGSGPVVYVVDPRSGTTVGRTTYLADSVVDVEALAVGPGGSIWVGDIGDNSAQRMSVAVYELPPVTGGDRTVSATRYDLQYQGGPRDAEALLVHPRTGRLYVVSKELFGGQIFAAPVTLRADRPNRLTPVGHTEGLVTDGAFFPDGRHALLRSYANARVYDTDRWQPTAGMPLPDQQQGEGLAMAPSGNQVLVSTEGRNSKVLAVELPEEVLDAVAAGEPESAVPTADAGGQGTPSGWSGVVEEDGYSTGAVVALSVVVLAAALGVRALLRVRASRRRSRSTR
jgi:hypothetical protein